jgi:hypothetical protein
MNFLHEAGKPSNHAFVIWDKFQAEVMSELWLVGCEYRDVVNFLFEGYWRSKFFDVAF